MDNRAILISSLYVHIIGTRKGNSAAQLNQVTKKKKKTEKERSISWLKITLADTFRLVFSFSFFFFFFFFKF